MKVSQESVHGAVRTALSGRTRAVTAASPDLEQAVQTVQQPGILGSWIKKLKIDAAFEGLGGAAGLVRLLLWFGAGFMVGYFFKKYAHYLVAALIGAVCALLLLEYYAFIEIHWGDVRTVLSGEQFFQLRHLEGFWGFIRENSMVCIVVIIGFLGGHAAG